VYPAGWGGGASGEAQGVREAPAGHADPGPDERAAASGARAEHPLCEPRAAAVQAPHPRGG
jgi:hypothetical protein